MKLTEYLRDKILLIVLHMTCMLLLAGFLYATGYETEYYLLVVIFWLLILTAWFGYGYYNRKCYFEELETALMKMDQRYLLGELMPASHRLEDQLYRYREYIESWVHEIKAPITGIDLMCENDKNDSTRRIRLENQKIENYVDMALYYARSDEVYKDYVIRKTDLQEIAAEVLKKNKLCLIQSRVQAEIDCGDSAYTDRKWITFILNQLVLNSMKYRREEGARIWISTAKYGHGVRLTVRDNGIGIREEELDRIFEKGFTGSNGRKRERSTGMGLYLCERLCQKLGIVIDVKSREQEGTEMILEFPVSSYLAKEL